MTPAASVVSLPRLASAWVDARFTAHRAALACFMCALVVFGVESVAWPFSFGRDGTTYLMYYADMWHAHPAYPALMLFRTPLAPLVLGSVLQLGGPLLAEAVMGVAFAVSVLAFATAAYEFGRAAAIVTAVAVLAYPGYGALFHQLSSDPIFALVFSLWTAAAVRALRRPRTRRFVLVAVLFLALVLSRPGSQIILVFAVAPLLLRATWRNRLAWSGAFLGVAIGLLAAWSGYNDARYGSFVVARAGWADIPFYRVFYMDKLVRSEDGPASRRLAAAISRDLIPKAPYRQLGIRTPDRYFEIASDRMWGDIVVVVDRDWGWHSDYAILRAVSIEAIRRNLPLYARDVTGAVWDELRYPYLWRAPEAARSLARAVFAKRGDSPAAASADPGGRYWWLASTPNGLPPVPSRVARLTREVARLQKRIPYRSGSSALASVLNRVSRIYPWPAVWLAVGLVAFVLRRPRGGSALLAVAGLAMAVIIETELGNPPVLEYGLPFDPAFVLFAVGALAAESGRRRSVASGQR